MPPKSATLANISRCPLCSGVSLMRRISLLFSFRTTSAERVTRLSLYELATPDNVFIVQGTISRASRTRVAEPIQMRQRWRGQPVGCRVYAACSRVGLPSTQLRRSSFKTNEAKEKHLSALLKWAARPCGVKRPGRECDVRQRREPPQVHGRDRLPHAEPCGWISAVDRSFPSEGTMAWLDETGLM